MRLARRPVRPAVWMLFACTSCHPASRASFERPEGADWIATVVVDARGRAEGVLRSTPAPVATGPDEHLLLFGYATAQLEPLGAQLGTTLRIQSPEACADRLPAPISARVLAGETLDDLAAEDVPPLGGDWIRARCPDPHPTLPAAWADSRCSATPCLPVLAPRGCRAMLRFPVCGELPDLEIRSFSSGAVCIDDSARPLPEGCTLRRATEGQGDQLDCGSCQIETRPIRPGPWITDRVRLVQASPSPSLVAIDRTRHFPSSDTRSGHLADAVFAGGRLWVSGWEGWRDTCAAGSPEGVLIALDPELSVTATRSAPPCLTRLVAEPRGGFLGVFRGELGWHLGRFDADGRLGQRSLSIIPEPCGTRHSVLDLVLTADRIGVMIQVDGGADDDLRDPSCTTFQLLDSELNLLGSTTLDGGRVQSVGFVPPRHAVFSSERGIARDVLAIDLDAGPSPTPSIFAPANAVQEPMFVRAPLGPELLLIGDRSVGGGLHVFVRKTWSHVTTQLGAYPVDTAPAPAPGRAWVALAAPAPERPLRWRALLTQLDGTSGRYVPEVLELGEGPPTRLRVGDDALFVVLPWSGEIVRVRSP